jgi:diguanylate cyclase (GGDEF)-like protein
MDPFRTHARPTPPWIVRTCIAGLVLGLITLGAFALLTQRAIVKESARSETTARLASVYQNARFWVGQEESLERKYRLEPSAAVLSLHDEAERNVAAYLSGVAVLDPSAGTKLFVGHLLRQNSEYVAATRSMFAAVRADDKRLVIYYDHVITDPIFTSLQLGVYGRAAGVAYQALDTSASLRGHETTAFRAGIIVLVLALILVGGLASVIRRGRLTQAAIRAAELERLEEMVMTDPLTGLRNHRGFHEDLAQEIQRTGRSGRPMSLVMFDADDLKAVNDAQGHKAGDEFLKTLAHAISITPRATDRAYRVGDDEFAVILHGAGAWVAFEFAQRVRARLAASGGRQVVSATAGISQALEFRSKDDLINEADLALMNAKRFDQREVVYTPEMEPFDESVAPEEDEHHTQTLAKALALAVDSKDSYTQSHCHTVATLCALIASELGFEGERLKRMRLAGLLHDVGKIGIPDSILKKPAKLDHDEFEEMKTHSALGEGIIQAAEMPAEARWVRHHHERIDGGGYPDGIADQDIPLEARIIHVADAFEAMTSDRPYRSAPGKEFAIDELRRNAGTQFDPQVVDALLRALGVAARVEGQAEPLALSA